MDFSGIPNTVSRTGQVLLFRRMIETLEREKERRDYGIEKMEGRAG